MRLRSLTIAVIFLTLAGLAGLLLTDSRRRAGIVPSPARIPLGGFEPVAVNLLYLRADSLLEQHRFPEAVTTISLVTELQPRVAEGWSVLGFLLAWSNSESSGDAEEQWRYAREGLRVMERGLLFNPNSRQLRVGIAQVYWKRLAEDSPVALVAEKELGRPPAAEARDRFRALQWDDPYFFHQAGWAATALLLGIRYAQLEEWEKARDAFIEALEQFTLLAEDPEAEEARERVLELRQLLDEVERRIPR